MLTKIEKAIIQEFNSLRIPAIYKIDNTFNILYVEHIRMDICPFLLKNKKQKLNINEEKKAYSAFLATTFPYVVIAVPFLAILVGNTQSHISIPRITDSIK